MLASPSSPGESAGGPTLEYVFTAFLVVYLAPWIVSEWRAHERANAILAVNLVTGWTVVGWLGALWWAGGAAIPRRARRRRWLRVVPAPVDAGAARSARRRRLVLAASTLLGVAALAGALMLAASTAPALRTETVAVRELRLHSTPARSAPVVAVLPAGCVVAVLKERGEWQRVWRTDSCAGAADSPASGWAESASTKPVP